MSTITEKAGASCTANPDTEWFDKIRREVEFECTFCDAIHKDMKELESLADRAYAFTAASMKGIYDRQIIAARWVGLYVFTHELVAAAEFKKENHQICGIDLGSLYRVREAALYRVELFCPRAKAA